MAKEVAFPDGDAPVLWIGHRGFLRVTGEELRTPVFEERMERLRTGLASLDGDFPGWLVGVDGETDDGLVLRFRDREAAVNVAAKLRDRGVYDR